MPKKYTLKNKDQNILEFEVEQELKMIKALNNTLEENVILKDKITSLKILDDRYFPATLKPDVNGLKKWIESRKIPSHRKHFNKIISSISGDNPSFLDYVKVSFALSLNDSFWIVPANSDMKWKDYNLYDNPFSKALELAAFMGHSKKLINSETSPELTTNGMLKKCWHRTNEGIYLYKGSSQMYANGGKEAYAEFYMTQVAKAMGFDHVKYDILNFHNELVSSCKLFTNENEGYLPMYYCLSKDERSLDDEEKIGAVENIYTTDALADLMVFDALIANTDRHLGNFGMIIDNNSGKLLRPAPIFDNGMSSFNLLEETELDSPIEIFNKLTSQFGLEFNRQISLGVLERHREGLNKLKSFKFTKHPEYNLDDKWLNAVEKYVQETAKFAIYCLDTKLERKQSVEAQLKEKNVKVKTVAD